VVWLVALLSRAMRDPALLPAAFVCVLAVVQAHRNGWEIFEFALVGAAASTTIALFWRDMSPDSNDEKQNSTKRSVSFEHSPPMPSYSSPQLQPDDESATGTEAVPSMSPRHSDTGEAVRRRRSESIQPDARSPPAHHLCNDPPPRFPMVDIRNHLFDIAPPAYPEVVYPNSRVPFNFGNEYFEGERASFCCT